MTDKNSGSLNNGNPQGNPNSAPRCGAKTRKGTPCKAPAMKNGRCRFHGGKSTGPRTPEGLERSRKANRKHGLYSRAVLKEHNLAEIDLEKLTTDQRLKLYKKSVNLLGRQLRSSAKEFGKIQRQLKKVKNKR